MTQLNGWKTTVLEYRKSILGLTGEYRINISSQVDDYFGKTLDIVDSSVKIIYDSDIKTRSLLSTQTQSACIVNLNNFLNSIIEFSGYAISNCISNSDVITLPAFKSMLALLDLRERELFLIPQIVTSSLNLQNIFTSSKLILSRIKRLFDASKIKFEGPYKAELNAKLEEVASIYLHEIQNLQSCFNTIDFSVDSAIANVKAQLEACQKFGFIGAKASPKLEISHYFTSI